jgi:hypothetical protein
MGLLRFGFRGRRLRGSVALDLIGGLNVLNRFLLFGFANLQFHVDPGLLVFALNVRLGLGLFQHFIVHRRLLLFRGLLLLRLHLLDLSSQLVGEARQFLPTRFECLRLLCSCWIIGELVEMLPDMRADRFEETENFHHVGARLQ